MEESTSTSASQEAPESSEPQRREVSADDEATLLALALTPEESQNWFVAPSENMPRSIGRFRLLERLGGGGFGDVYRAFDPRLDRDVALKVLRDPLPSVRVMERFFREARAAAQLDHPGVVPLHDAGRDEGRCWICYQFISGPTLVRVIETKAVEPAEAARIVRELADALDHCHRAGVYHRDLKPANVILDPAGRPRLTDFGLARRVHCEPTMTRDGAVLGTPAYMSPEQAAGQSHKADARSDLYSLGVIFHELLTGQRPAEPASSSESCSVVLEHPAFRQVPRHLREVCVRALAADPAERYPDARALVADLNGWLSAKKPSTVGGKVLRALSWLGGTLATMTLILAGTPAHRSAAAPSPNGPRLDRVPAVQIVARGPAPFQAGEAPGPCHHCGASIQH